MLDNAGWVGAGRVEGQVQGHESGAEGCAHGAVGACRTPHKNHSVAVSLMEGVRTTGLGPLGTQGCFQFIRGWQWQAPAQSVCSGRFRENRQASCGAG